MKEEVRDGGHATSNESRKKRTKKVEGRNNRRKFLSPE